jgi:hypothetical protein
MRLVERGIDSGRLGTRVYAQCTSVADQIPLHGAVTMNGAVILGWRIGGIAVRYDHGGRVAHLMLPGGGGWSTAVVSGDGDYGRVLLMVLWRIQEI